MRSLTLLQDPSAVPGLSHDDKESSPESISDPSSLPPMSVAAPQQLSPPQSSPPLQPPPPHSASTPAALPAHGVLPFPEPLSVFKSADGFVASHAQSGYSAQCNYPPPDAAQALVPVPTCDNRHEPAASQPSGAGGINAHPGSPDTAWMSRGPEQQPVNGQAADIGSDGQGTSSPVQIQRRRAAKSHQHKDIKLAALSAENSVHSDPMKHITMMTVRDKSCVVSPRSKKLKLSPLPGLSLSPVKAAGAQWPPNANALHQYGQPAAAFPAGAGRAANSTAVRTNSWRAAQVPTAMDLDPDLDPPNVVDLFHGVQSPTAHKAQQQGFGTSSLQNPYGIVAASEDDMRMALSNVESSANKQKELVDAGGHDSAQSLKAADAKAAQMQEQLQQQRPMQGQRLAPAETPGSTAIDLCDDDLAPKGPHLSAALTEQQIKADEQMARSLQQTGEPLQQLNVRQSCFHDAANSAFMLACLSKHVCMLEHKQGIFACKSLLV